MGAHRFGVQVPERCRLCGTRGHVKLERTIRGGVSVSTWCCEACGGEWPVAANDHIVQERRSGTERRATTRGDRRDS